jgi:hypothetical protein
MYLLNNSKVNYKQAKAKEWTEQMHGRKQNKSQVNFCHLSNINNYIITTMLTIMQWGKNMYTYIRPECN